MDSFFDLGIIGAEGTVGSALANQFSLKYNKIHKINRNNFERSSEFNYDILIISCFEARKYLVNKYPLDDINHINYVFNILKNYKANIYILISTVDVYELKIGDENTKLNFFKAGYSFNRYFCELLMKNFFEKCFILRLQGLVGNGIKKNYLYDIKFNNNIEKIDKYLEIQYYPLSRISSDVEIIINNKINLVNLSCEPLSLENINKYIKIPNFNLLENKKTNLNNYSVKSIFSEYSCSSIKEGFWVNKDDIISSIDDYLNS